MTPKQKELNKKEIKDLLKSKDYSEDRWGHYKKISGEKTYRFKVSKNVLRYEVKSAYGWVRLASGYWKDITIKDNKLVGLKY